MLDPGGATPRIVKSPTPAITSRAGSEPKAVQYYQPPIISPASLTILQRLSVKALTGASNIARDPFLGSALAYSLAGALKFARQNPMPTGDAWATNMRWLGERIGGVVSPIARRLSGPAMLLSQGGDRMELDWAKQQGRAPIQTQQNPYPWLRPGYYQGR